MVARQLSSVAMGNPSCFAALWGWWLLTVSSLCSLSSSSCLKLSFTEMYLHSQSLRVKVSSVIIRAAQICSDWWEPQRLLQKSCIWCSLLEKNSTPKTALHLLQFDPTPAKSSKRDNLMVRVCKGDEHLAQGIPVTFYRMGFTAISHWMEPWLLQQKRWKALNVHLLHNACISFLKKLLVMLILCYLAQCSCRCR